MTGFEDYIKDLSPELQEKAKACKSMDELLQFADENDIEIPRETLAKVAGGCGTSSSSHSPKCPNCGSKSLSSVVIDGQTKTQCNNCMMLF